MDLLRLYYEEYHEGGRIIQNLIFPVVRNSYGYGIFYWRLKNGKPTKFDVREISDAPAYFCNNSKHVKDYDEGYRSDYNRDSFKLIDVTGNKDYQRFIIYIVFVSDDFVSTYKGWIK